MMKWSGAVSTGTVLVQRKGDTYTIDMDIVMEDGEPFREMCIRDRYSSTTQNHYVKDYSNQAWAYRAMDDATMQQANPWLYTDPD